MTTEFTRLTWAWIEWMNLLRMPGVSVSTDCDDDQIGFLAEDQSFYVNRDDDWWIIDEVDDRNKRYNATAHFSTFELMEKYLIWRWASFTRNALSLEAFGPQLLKRGYSTDVKVAPTGDEWRVELQTSAGSAILSTSQSTIFSHLMLKSADEIEQMILPSASG